MEIKGEVKNFIYPKNGQPTNNGFSIFKLKKFNTDETITVVGYSKSLTVGFNVRVQGDIKNHPRYGEQIQAKKIEIVLPRRKEKIIKILVNNVEGVGKITAEKIYQHFGDETLYELKKNQEKINILNLGPRITDKIKNSLKTFFDNNSNIIDMSEKLGISTRLSEKINNTLGEDAFKAIEKNPYTLINKVEGIGFKRADGIAKELGFTRTSYSRIHEGIRYSLKQSLKNGDLYLNKKELINRASRLLGLNGEYIKSIGNAINSCEGIIEDDDRVYLQKIYHAEKMVAERLKEIHKGMDNLNINIMSITRQISKIEKEVNINFSKSQRQAIILALSNKVSIITGGPGTGKTTITKAIIEIYKELYKGEIFLAAPTGKAARRLKEATGMKAQTIHRLLEASIMDGKIYFKRNKHNKLEGKLLLIDESSMIDIFLMKDLLQAVPIQMSLVFLGDIDQLPSIGPGNVLKSIIDSKKIPLAKLEHIYRQAKNSLNIVNAHRINKGEGIIKKTDREYKKDFIFLSCNNDIEIESKIIALLKERLLKAKTVNPIKDIQILTPMKRGLLGANNLNVKIQELLNSRGIEKNELFYSGILYREGDKVMQIGNNYKKDIFNGDCGIIKRINPIYKSIIVTFEDTDCIREIVYTEKEIKEIIPSYAITIHKSQGSEYPIVIIPICKSHTIMLNRSLLYTALTRAKRLAVIVGEENALNFCIKNNRMKKRNTNLDRIIKDLYAEDKDYNCIKLPFDNGF